MSSHLRTVAFDYETRAEGDGLTLEGYAAVYDIETVIRDWLGTYTEVIRQGAAARSLTERTPVLQFDHGKHPMVGSLPLGVGRWSEDARGLHVEATLSDNWLVQPVRDAIAERAITGMSFRFSVPEGGDVWTITGEDEHREVNDMDVYEGGPVVFPAYDATSVGVRDYTAWQPANTDRGSGTPDGGDEPETAPDPQARGDEASQTMTSPQAKARLLVAKYA